jgi:ferrochelatase
MPAIGTNRLAAISAEHIRQSLADRQEWLGGDVALVLAAHGTIVEPAGSIENGLEVTEALCGAIRTSLAPDFGLIVNGWLNHTRGGRWTDPPIDQALRQVRAAGFERVVYFPYGFLADNAESQLEGRVALRAQPELESLHLPCLNESRLLVETLAEQVISQDSSVIAAAS